MTKTICILVCLLLILVTTNKCKSTTTNEQTNYGLEKFEAIRKNKNCTIYLIPNSGCNSCISNVEKFALDNVSNDYYIFVFTRIASFKLFKNRFEKSFFERKNVILDTANIFTFPNPNEEIYPLSFVKKNGIIRLSKTLNLKSEAKD